MGETGIPAGSRMRGFAAVRNLRSDRRWPELRRAVGLPVQDEAVGVVAQSIQRRRGEQAIGGEGLIPLGEVEVAGDDGGGGLVALGDQVVQIFVGRRAQGFRPKSSMIRSGTRASAASLRS